MAGMEELKNEKAAYDIVHQFLGQFTGGEHGVIYKDDFINTTMKNQALLELLSPFYGTTEQ